MGPQIALDWRRRASLALVTDWLRRASLALAVAFVALMLGLFALRVGHPYLLEWQEGAMVDQVLRILAGRPLYAEPSVEFVAQIYAPLYFYASAAATYAIGPGFVALRLVSIAATLGCLACMGLLAWHETHSRSAVAIALGLFAATYPVSAAFLDVARVDALFLCLCMAATWAVRRSPSRPASLAAAALFALAFLTKQQGLPFCAAMVVWVAVARGVGAALWLAVPFGALAGGATLWLAAATDGWSLFYLYALPAGHELFWPMALRFWWMDLLVPLAPACGVALAWLFALGRTRRFADLAFWLLLLGVGVGVSLASRMHWGGAANVVMPAYMTIALAFGVGVVRLPELLEGGARVSAALVLLLALQMTWLVYDPRPLLPRAQDRRAGDAFVAALAGLEGDVLATWHGYLPRLAGKAVFAHRSAVHDVMRSGQADAIAKLERAFDEALASHRFGAIVVDQPYFLRDYEKAPLARHYRHVGPMLEPGLEIGGLLGYRANPHLYLPRSGSESTSDAEPPAEAAASPAGADGSRRR